VHGNWGDVDKGSGDVLVTGQVVTTYIEQAKTDWYFYIVKPDITANDAKKLAANIPVKVLENTPALQALQVGKRIMAVFYAPGDVSISQNQKLSVSAPCLVISEPKGSVWISDPTQKLAEINLTINKHAIAVKLPAGDMAGSSIKVNY